MKLLKILALALLLPSVVNAQQPFSKAFDYSKATGWFIHLTNGNGLIANDSNFVLIGEMVSLPITTRNVYITCFSYNGDSLWHRRLFFSGNLNGTNAGSIAVRINKNLLAVNGYEVDTTSRGDSIKLGQPFL